MASTLCSRIGFATALLTSVAAAAEAPKVVYKDRDWITLHESGNADQGQHACDASTATPQSVLMLSIYADGGKLLAISHAGWNAPDNGPRGTYQLVIDGSGLWTIQASMRGRMAFTRNAPGSDAFGALSAALARGGEATLRSEDGRLLDRFSLRGSAGALAALERCAAELLPAEWGEDVDARAAMPSETSPQPARPGATPGGPHSGLAFADYPATSRLRGRPVEPDFRGRDAHYRSWRTRLREAVAGGVTFAGRYTLAEIGCGTGCRSVLLVDLQTGEVGPFPYGGEEYSYLDLRFEPDSRLLKVRWTDLSGNPVCMEQDMLLVGMDWQVLAERREASVDRFCD